MKNLLKISIFLLLLSFLNIKAQEDSLLSIAQNLSPLKRLNFLLRETWKNRAQDPLLALKLGKKSIELAKQLNDKSDLAKAFNFVGVIYRNIGEYNSSYKMYLRALQIAKEIKDSTQLAYSHNNIGGYYGYEHKYFLALENVFEAKRIFEKINNQRGIAFCDIQAGLWYLKLQQYDDALKEFRAAIKIREKIGDKFGIAVAKSLISDIYYQKGEYEKAYEISSKLLPIYRKFNDKKGIGVSLGTLGGVFYHRGNFKQALAYRLEALKYLLDVHYWNGVVNNLIGLGEIYHQLNKDDLAIKSLQRSIRLAKKYNYNKGLIEAYLVLARIYNDKKDYRKLRYYHNKAIAIQDSLDLLEKETRLEEFKKIFTINDMRQHFINLENKLERNKLILYGSVVIVVIVLIFLIVFYLQNEKLKKKEKLLQELNHTKDKLFSLIAHDLKSPFSALFGYADIMLSDFDDFSKDEIKENIRHMKSISQNLFSMVENLLDWARNQNKGVKYNPEIVNVNEEISKIISFYEDNAKSKDISIVTDFIEELSAFCDVSMFNTVVRNLINNAIKFTKPGGKITVKTELLDKEGKIKVTVQDTGVGMSKEQIEGILKEEATSTIGTEGEKGTGLGMILVKEMVKRNEGELFIESEPEKGTKISFTVPLAK